MYKCNNCQREFEQYDTIDDSGEKWYVCPYCRGTDFDEEKKCEHCEEQYIESKFDGLCPNCLTEIEERFSKVLNDKFTKFEIEALNTILDGRNLE